MSTGWLLGALDLRKVGYNIETVDGWDSFPEVRSSRSEHGFRHGERRGSRIFYRARPLTLTMGLLGVANSGDPAGLTKEEYIQIHLDDIFGALHVYSGEILVTRTVGAASRVGICRVDDAFTVNQRTPGSRAMVIRLTMINPFWLGASFSGAIATGNFTNLGSAPINDMTLTFTTAGSVANGEDLVVCNAAGVVVDLREDTVLQGGVPVNGLVTVSNPWILQLEPGANNLTVTGTVSMSGNHAYF